MRKIHPHTFAESRGYKAVNECRCSSSEVRNRQSHAAYKGAGVYVIMAGAFFAVMVFFGVSYAQVTEPPINLPIFSPTPTATASVVSDVITYYTVTPTATQTVASKEFIDDAETGSEIYFLAFFSLVAGLGLFFIKKYFDIRRYSI